MKRFSLILIVLIMIVAAQAQVTLDKKYDYSTAVVELETLGFKYYLMDVPNAQCRIYNPDHSLYKTISCPVPSGCYLSDIKFISEKLFDTDAGLELAYTYYKYVPTKDSYYYEYDSRIINDNGTEITFIDSGLYLYVNKVAESTYKLFAYCFDYSVSPEKVWTNIYNLPAKVVSASILQPNNSEITLGAFPNPAENKVKVAYSLPENIGEGTLHLVDNQGRHVERFIIDRHSDYLLLDVSRFQAGVYQYFIEYAHTKTPAKKLIIR